MENGLKEIERWVKEEIDKIVPFLPKKNKQQKTLVDMRYEVKKEIYDKVLLKVETVISLNHDIHK